MREYRDVDGDFIKEYYSSAQAGRVTGVDRVHIGDVCRGDRHTSGGYVWKFK